MHRHRRYFILFLGAVLFLSPAAVAQTVPQSREQITLSFAPLVKQVSPAIVNIYTQRRVQQNMSPLFSDPVFSQLFGSMLPPGFSRERMENSLGSGVIIRADGLIVTSNHVIKDADQIRVVLLDRREFDAKLVASDARSDLAVLKVENKGEKLPYLELKDSDEAEVGDLVIALGNPFGVGRTVTSGIISAIAHGAIGSSDLDYFIQTDAAINPGNSGGALVAMDGKLVGINSAIYSRDGGNMGIGFAVPSNMVRVLLNAVEQGRKDVVHPWIGLDGQAITPELARSLDLPEPTGVLVNKMNPGSPAATAGVMVGDVIVAVNGHTVEDPEAFHYRLATLPVGQSIDIGLIRKGQSLHVHMTVMAPPEDPPRDKTTVSGRNPLAGTTLENLSPAVAEDLGHLDTDRGVIIVEIKNNTIAANIGLQPGDLIVAINAIPIQSVGDALSAVRESATRWRLTVQRGDNTLTLMVGG